MDSVNRLRELQEEYHTWLDTLPENLQSTSIAEKLEEICSLAVEQFEIDLPLGFGRDDRHAPRFGGGHRRGIHRSRGRRGHGLASTPHIQGDQRDGDSARHADQGGNNGRISSSGR